MACARFGWTADVRGDLVLQPLEALPPASSTRGSALVRMPADGGPLFPYLDEDDLDVVLRLGPNAAAHAAAAPETVRLTLAGEGCGDDVLWLEQGARVTVANPLTEAQQLSLTGLDEVLEVPSLRSVRLPAGALANSGDRVLTNQSGTWTCRLRSLRGPFVRGETRRAEAGRLTMLFEHVIAQPAPADLDGEAEPIAAIEVSLTFWFRGRRLCPEGAVSPEGCHWTTQGRLDGTSYLLATVSLARTDLYNGPEAR